VRRAAEAEVVKAFIADHAVEGVLFPGHIVYILIDDGCPYVRGRERGKKSGGSFVRFRDNVVCSPFDRDNNGARQQIYIHTYFVCVYVYCIVGPGHHYMYIYVEKGVPNYLITCN